MHLSHSGRDYNSNLSDYKTLTNSQVKARWLWFIIYINGWATGRERHKTRVGGSLNLLGRPLGRAIYCPTYEQFLNRGTRLDIEPKVRLAT